MKLRYTHSARADLRGISEYLTPLAPRAAVRILDEIRLRAEGLREHPFAYALRPKIASEVRAFRVEPYLVIYRVQEDTVTVLRIVHGARDLPRLFRKQRP